MTMQQEIYQTARILIVDDESANVMVLEQILEDWGYAHLQSTTDPHQVLPLCHEFKPHAILLDLMMPELDGFAIMKQLRTAFAEPLCPPILVLTADINAETKRRALASGASDFLTKPFDFIELSLRLNNLLRINFLQNRLRQQNNILEERVVERTHQLAKSEHETAVCLGIAGDYRDDDTGRHTQRVGATAAVLAWQDGASDNAVQLMLQAAPLHDVGKIGIPDSVLLKPGRLTPEEFSIMKMHSVLGHGILSRHHTPLLQLASNIALSHHERWDGTGYPSGMAQNAIPLEGRIVAIADVFDPLTHQRPYKEAWPIDHAVAEIQSQAGRQFDPDLVKVFLQHLNLILEAREQVQHK